MYDEEVKTAIALIKQKSEFIESKLEELVGEIKTLTLKLDTNSVTKDDFDRHNVQDRWMFGIIITIVIGIFIKVMFN